MAYVAATRYEEDGVCRRNIGRVSPAEKELGVWRRGYDGGCVKIGGGRSGSHGDGEDESCSDDNEGEVKIRGRLLAIILHALLVD
jgi:hypothetical protein